MATIYDFTAERLDGTPAEFGQFRDRVLLIVNTASRCGFTPQFEGLEALQRTYAARGFDVLGFPCNQFAGQDPGDADEIARFCRIKYGVKFPMFAKVEVNGPGAHPLYTHLKAAKPGFLGLKGIKWNFTKFLIGRDGKVMARFGPTTKPEAIGARIEALL